MAEGTRDYLLLFINGQERRVRGVDAFKTLSSYLREDEQKTGTKIVCEEGDCGACTVMVGRERSGRLSYRPINSCIQFLHQLDLSHVVTVEGLAAPGSLNQVQESMVACHGAQCGYCTPGFVVSMCALFEEKQAVTRQDLRDALTGNLCRCTGYDSIINAGLAVEPGSHTRLRDLYPESGMLAAFGQHGVRPVRIEAGGCTFYGAADLESAVRFKADNPGCVIVAGATDIGVYWNKRDFRPTAMLSLARVAGLDGLKVEGGSLVVGARTTLADIEAFTADVLPQFNQVLWTFGGPGIKHAGTLAGNIANGSPIADSLPMLYVLDAVVCVSGRQGQRRLKVAELYAGYKKLLLEPDEIITSVHIPLPGPAQKLKLYKISRRKNLDISVFTAAFLLEEQGGKIGSIRVAFGGVAPTVVRLPALEDYLKGKPHCLETYQSAREVVLGEIKPISDVRGSARYRQELAARVLVKFFHETAPAREAVCP